jgi:benzoylformate decarboxylase
VFGFSSQEHVQGTDLPGLDFVSIARGLACSAVHAGSAKGLHDALDKAFSSERPTLIEVEVEDRDLHR